jgi:xylan 1,4-beta-xylosidase
VDLFNPVLDPRFQPCYVAETIWQMKDVGLDWSCYYHIRDWYVSYETFAKVFSPHGTAFMTRWWNRQAQFSGLIDYQNQLRPAFYTFKLLSRMAGNKLNVTSTNNKVHGFATHDTKLDMHNLMVWNFSDTATVVKVNFEDLPKDMRIRHFVLDASGGGLDENQRLRPDPFINLKKGTQVISLKLEPWAVHYWSFE